MARALAFDPTLQPGTSPFPSSALSASAPAFAPSPPPPPRPAPPVSLSLRPECRVWQAITSLVSQPPSASTLDAALAPLADAMAATFLHAGDLPRALRLLGGDFVAPHLDPARIAATFGPCYPDTPALVHEASFGITPSVDPFTPSDLPARLAKGPHLSARQNPQAVTDRLISDLARGRIFVLPLRCAPLIPFLRPSPLGDVLRKGKHRIVHDLSFTGRMPDGTPDWSLNTLTDPSAVPACDIGDVFERFLLRIYKLRLRYPDAHIVLAKMDVKDAFRQLYFDPRLAPLFSYRWGSHVVIDLRMGFGWAGAPGFFYRWMKALKAFMRHLSPSAVTTTIWNLCSITPQLTVEPPPSTPPAVVPRDPAFPLDAVAHGDAPFDTDPFLDDNLLAEVNHEDRPLTASAALEFGHYQLFGHRGEEVLQRAKATHWASRASILGVGVCAHTMTVFLEEDQSEELRELLYTIFAPALRATTPRWIMRLVGKLRCRAYCIRPGRYFLRRLINAAGCLRNLDTLVPLGPDFHADLAMWRELLEDPELQASSYRTPLYNHLRRTPEILVVGDAMAESGGGFICGMGLDVAAWWKVSWPSSVVDRFHRTSQRLEDPVNMITIAHLELATLILGLATMTELLPACAGRAVLALADNTNTVSWARRAGAKDWRAAALVRLIGLMEARQRFSLAAKHIAGVKNEEADFISRHGEEEVTAFLADRPAPSLACMPSPPRMWSQVPPSSAYLPRVQAILLTTTSVPASRMPPTTPTMATGTSGGASATANSTPSTSTPTTPSAPRTASWSS